MKNILVTTMGTTWQVVPELLGFTNLEMRCYQEHSRFDEIKKLHQIHNIQPVNEVMIITTGGEDTDASVEYLEKWLNSSGLDYKLFRLKSLNELATIEECRYMADYIYRVVLYASELADNLYLSLAGGRKTMSADMQQAGMLFGFSAMLHVVSKPPLKNIRQSFADCDFINTYPSADLIDSVMPLVVFDKRDRDILLDANPKITSKRFAVAEEVDCKTGLYDEINTRINNAKNILINYTKNLIGGMQPNNFRALYSLSPLVIEKLKNETFDYDFIKQLPKAELHCHFGGIAHPEELVEIAAQNNFLDYINVDFDKFLKRVKTAVKENNLEKLHQLVPNVKKLRTLFKGIPEPYTVAGFISQFSEKTDLLKKFIYEDSSLKSIGINEYEKLGDLQGSGLMQSEESIRAACRIIGRQCEEHNIKYMEIRCSPVNYTRGALRAEDVVSIMIDEFEKIEHTYFSLLFIASRHGKMSSIYQHIELSESLLEKDSKFSGFFAGFDLAGSENYRSPKELRECFLPLMEKCIYLTIHAGETESAENIWQAVYHLNADRIGHGLKLVDNPDLIRKFKDSHITLEMCPSSNDQIVGFDKNNKYPLKEYLDRGIKVTVNTDNPGISLTNLTNEYIKANELSEYKLSKWDALQLIKNAYKASFTSFDKRQVLILKAEEEIINLVKDL